MIDRREFLKLVPMAVPAVAAAITALRAPSQAPEQVPFTREELTTIEHYLQQLYRNISLVLANPAIDRDALPDAVDCAVNEFLFEHDRTYAALRFGLGLPLPPSPIDSISLRRIDQYETLRMTRVVLDCRMFGRAFEYQHSYCDALIAALRRGPLLT